MHQPGRPVLVTLLAIVQLIVGGGLLACGALGLVAALAGSSAATVTITTAGQSTTRTYDTQQEMVKEAPSYNLFFFGGGVAGLVLHLAMLAGALGLLLQRGWGWWLSLAWCLLHVGYEAVTLGYLFTVAIPAANRMVRVVPRDDNGVCNSLVNGNTFYHLFWVLFAVGLSLYALVVLVVLVLPPVRRAFTHAAARADDESRRGRRRRSDEEDDRFDRRARDDY